MISLETLKDFFIRYINDYRKEFKRFTAPTPNGNNYPALNNSPYLRQVHIKIGLCVDGVFIYVIDENVVPPSASGAVPNAAWLMNSNIETPTWIKNGNLPYVKKSITVKDQDLHISLYQHDSTVEYMVWVLTFGTLSKDFILKIPGSTSTFWLPLVIYQLGFGHRSNPSRGRFFDYLEVHPHVVEAAWDLRTIPLRVKADVRRDFKHAVTELSNGETGGYITFHSQFDLEIPYREKLEQLWSAIEGLESLLADQNDANESLFHDYLLANNILVDVYGEVMNKPVLKFPEGTASVSGKQSVIPDFVVKYSDFTYNFIEIERAAKQINTSQGHPRQEYNQAAYQFVEWEEFFANYPQEAKKIFPRFDRQHCIFTLIIGRDDQKNGPLTVEKKANLKRLHKGITNIWTYDDLLSRAKAAFVRLSALG